MVLRGFKGFQGGRAVGGRYSGVSGFSKYFSGFLRRISFREIQGSLRAVRIHFNAFQFF